MDKEKRYEQGQMVFWLPYTNPWWVIEWQADNGDGCYWLVDAQGEWATATPDEVTETPKNI